MAHDREQAIEAERASAQKRLADAAERYEASAQQARMRLGADHDRRLADAEDEWRNERRELQEALKAARALVEELKTERDEGVAAARDAERRSHAAALKVRSRSCVAQPRSVHVCSVVSNLYVICRSFRSVRQVRVSGRRLTCTCVTAEPEGGVRGGQPGVAAGAGGEGEARAGGQRGRAARAARGRARPPARARALPRQLPACLTRPFRPPLAAC